MGVNFEGKYRQVQAPLGRKGGWPPGIKPEVLPACVEERREPLGPKWARKGRNPRGSWEVGGGILGRGQGNCLLGEGAFPAE